MSADKKALQIENDVLKMGGLALSSTFLSNCDGNISIGCLQRPLSNQIAFEKLYSLQIPLKVCKRIVIQCTKPKHVLKLHFYQLFVQYLVLLTLQLFAVPNCPKKFFETLQIWDCCIVRQGVSYVLSFLWGLTLMSGMNL